MDSVGWLNEQVPHDATPRELALAAERQQDARAAIETKCEEAERQAAAENRLEALQFAERQFGNPLAEMSRARSALSDADDVCRDLRDQLRKAEAKRSRAEGNVKFWAERAGEAAAVVSRAAPAGGVEGAVSRAAEALREHQAQQRVERLLSRSSPGRRPKGGFAVRGDGGEVTCQDCLNMGATEAESFAIHHPELLPPMGTEVTVPDDSERSARGYGREITRVA